MNELTKMDWDEILKKTASFATSHSAKELILDTRPCESQNLAKESLVQILTAQAVLNAGRRPHMESLDFFFNWYPRLEKKATLKSLELKDLRLFCIEALALKEIVQSLSIENLSVIIADLLNAEEPLSAIEQIMTEDGEIRNDASELVYKLIQERNNETKRLQNTLEKIVKNFNMENLLQEKYVTTREGRWVLPIKSGMRHQLKGIIHATSQSKQTVFMEPQDVVEINNRLRQIEVELEEEIERLLRQLSDYLYGLRAEIQISKEILLKMDTLLARSQFAQMIKGQNFQFDKNILHLESLKHPLLLLQAEDVVPNSVHFDQDNRVLLLSGPNAGGKTVLLKAIGLAAHMARCGLPLPVESGSKLPYFKNISITIGDEQSVDAHLSTFAAHLKSLNHASQLKSSDSLILIDEICGSTDPEEGAALAKSFIETYIKNGVYAVVTSHLGSLKLDWDQSVVQHGSLEFHSDAGPTYQLLKGIAGQSMAIQTAKRSGVDKPIIDRAIEHLKPEKRKQMQELEEIESLKSKLHKIMKETAEEKSKFHALKMDYDKRLAEFEKEKNSLIKKQVRDAEKKIDQIIAQENVKDIFKKHDTIQKINTDLPKIIKASQQGTSQEERLAMISSPDEFAKAFPAGSKVYIKSLDQDAIVQGRPGNKSLVPVLSRSMRLTIPWQDLTAPLHGPNPTQNVLRQKGNFAYSPSDKDPSIDLRGLSADEAMKKLDAELDRAASHDQDRVKIIHGHGTNTLKKLVRGFLSKSLYVKKWQAGSAETGGDGITWAEL